MFSAGLEVRLSSAMMRLIEAMISCIDDSGIAGGAAGGRVGGLSCGIKIARKCITSIYLSRSDRGFQLAPEAAATTGRDRRGNLPICLSPA